MAQGMPVLVVKYGGSSLAKPDDFHAVAQHQRVLYDSGSQPVAVNSARKGVSDRLLAVYRSQTPLKEYADGERAFYSDVFKTRADRDALMRDLEAGFAATKEVLEAPAARYDNTHRESFVLARGEAEAGTALRYLLADFVPDIRFLDGHDAGVVAKRMRGPVDVAKSVQNIKQRRGAFCYGGFVGMDPEKPESYCLLDRNSTDVTAALVAAALGAEEYWNIKDVDGVYFCDPSLLEGDGKPRVIGRLSFGEAVNITRNGSPVIHSTGLLICDDCGVKIRIKSLGGSGNGTLISAASGTSSERPYAALSSGLYACATVVDSTMDNPGEGRGYAADVMKILSDAGLDIINPTGPGTAMSVVVAGGNEVTKGRGVDIGDVSSMLTRGLRERGRAGKVYAREIGCITITGDAMRGRPGTIREIAQVMEEEDISMSMMGQGDEQVGTPVVSFCVDPEDYRRAMNALAKKLF